MCENDDKADSHSTEARPVNNRTFSEAFLVLPYWPPQLPTLIIASLHPATYHRPVLRDLDHLVALLCATAHV